MARKKKEEAAVNADENKMFKNAEKADPTSQEGVRDAESDEKNRANEFIGSVGKIDAEEISKAVEVFQRYKEGKAITEQRAIDNQEWYRARYAQNNKPGQGDWKPESKSAWLFNSIINKHADAMDNIPAPNILPREESDQACAEMLSKIVPLVLEARQFEKVYDSNWYDKLITGGSIYKVFWDNDLENGLGDVNIRSVDVLNLFWENGVEDIQDSQNIFHVEYQHNDTIIEQYPFMKEKLAGGQGQINEYRSENVNKDHEQQSLVFDWYYKRKVGTKTVVHLCKFCCGEVLWASENTDDYAEVGYYEHGLYPFVMDSMFPLKNSPYGFGYVDIMKQPQYYIDKLDEAIMKNALLASKPRWFKKLNNNINLQQYADWDRDFVDVDGGQINDDNIRQISINTLPVYVTNHLQQKIDELKETSGNRDFSQGQTSSGVTSGSAIAALQEAGSKLSRDMIKASYRAFKQIVELVVELIRQFYTEDRYFRIDQPNGETEFIAFNNSQIQTQEMGVDLITGEMKVRRPVFDYKISAQKMSPFSRTAQNDMAIQLFQLGTFNPQMADQVLPMLEMMDFEGVDKIRKTVSENGQLYKQLEQMTALAMQFAQGMDAATGGMAGAMQQVAQAAQGADGMMAAQSPGGAAPVQLNKPTGADGLPATDNTQASKARLRAANASVPK